MPDDFDVLHLVPEPARQLAPELGDWLDLVYGGLPPAPETLEADLIHRQDKTHRREHWRVTAQFGEERVNWVVLLHLPLEQPSRPMPVVVHGDGCWETATPAVVQALLAGGCALATFNRTEIVPDRHVPRDRTPLYRALPDHRFRAIAAWAWGFHRTLDFAAAYPSLDVGRSMVIGHSRGGKAALLAGVTDARPSVVAPNNSGCAGAGSFKVRGDKCERIADICTRFPHWFPQTLADFAGREADLPADQHLLLEAVAPRALITTEADEDLWANPLGTRAMHEAAQPAFAASGAGDRLCLHQRAGVHAHLPEDWAVALAFAQRMWPLGHDA